MVLITFQVVIFMLALYLTITYIELIVIALTGYDDNSSRYILKWVIAILWAVFFSLTFLTI